MTEHRPKVLILGGGMAGMTAAWALSRPGWERRLSSITVLQRGWRLGGKGASGRGRFGRIEEHGLHIWLGYYDNAFRLMREVYAELDRPSRAPDVPLRTFDDVFLPAGRVGLAEAADDAWSLWIARFSEDDDPPGSGEIRSEPMSVSRFVRRSLTLLRDFARSIDIDPPVPEGVGPSVAGMPDPRRRLESWAEVAMSELLRRFLRSDRGHEASDLAMATATDARLRHAVSLIDLVVTSLLGIWRDRLLEDPRGFAAVNDEDYRSWMRRHGAAEPTLRSALVNGVYDLVFGYRDGDPSQPAFAAGTGLILSAKMFFDYRGSLFWKMATGMGDAVFAPLYEVLRARGVAFRFFSDVKALHVDPDGRTIPGVTVAHQVDLRDPSRPYEPLIRVNGLPCWPARPRREQLLADGHLGRENLECSGSLGREVRRTTLRRGEDFDELVFALPVGVVGSTCQELLAVSRRWRNVARHLATVGTQSAQVWTTETFESLRSQVGVTTVAGLGHPLDTYSDMGQVLASEGWSDVRPQGLAYFCSALRDAATPVGSPTGCSTEADGRVHDALADHLRDRIRYLWPAAVTEDGAFRWEILAAPDGVEGPERLEHQYWQANVDPSDRYVQSLPMTDRFRLAADESGFHHLVLAGDWTENGLNAGCIEAAVRSGLQAANVVLGRPIDDGVGGFYPT